MVTRRLNCFLGLCLCVAMMLTMIMPELAFAEVDEAAPEGYVEESSDVPALTEEEIPPEEQADTVSEDEPEVEEPAGEPEVQEPEEEPEVQNSEDETELLEPSENREEQVIESGNSEEESTGNEENTVTEEETTLELANTEALNAVVGETEPEPDPDEIHYGEVEFAGICSEEETEDPETILKIGRAHV